MVKHHVFFDLNNLQSRGHGVGVHAGGSLGGK